jgi:hypothetical protein
MAKVQFQVNGLDSNTPSIFNDDVTFDGNIDVNSLSIAGVDIFTAIPPGETGPEGPEGQTGPTGATGATGAGVATGGTAGQYLTKVDSTNYNTQWSTLDLSDKAPLNSPTFTGTVTTSNNLVVNGDLTVNGANFTASTTSIVIEDNMLQLAHQNAANTVDLGLVVGYNDGTAKHAGIARDVSDDKWKLFKGVSTEPTTTVAFGEGSLDALAVGAFEATSATINGTIIPSSKTLVATDSTAYVVPSQTGNSGKYLTTNGTTTSWGSVSASGGGEDPTPTVFLLMGA